SSASSSSATASTSANGQQSERRRPASSPASPPKVPQMDVPQPDAAPGTSGVEIAGVEEELTAVE
ncbi:MAG: hypothetical protein KDE47_10620, partial [Caldilineaceae bacterium]|nr:hypothetical protein [Caldilineaceae bacterium]